MNITHKRELATVLAALAYYTNDMDEGDRLSHDVDPEGAIYGIATDMGTLDPLNAQEINALAERLNLGPEQKPTITVSIDREDDKFTVFIPKAIADEIDVDFIEPDDTAPESYYQNKGFEHPRQTHERLYNDDNHVFKEFV